MLTVHMCIIEKKSVYKWTWAVYIGVIQGSTVQFVFLSVSAKKKKKEKKKTTY